MPLNSREFSLLALVCRTAFEPSVTTDQSPPDLDQLLMLLSSKSALNAVAALALVARTTAPAVNTATAPVTSGQVRLSLPFLSSVELRLPMATSGVWDGTETEGSA